MFRRHRRSKTKPIHDMTGLPLAVSEPRRILSFRSYSKDNLFGDLLLAALS
jgi:hypothetical protein